MDRGGGHVNTGYLDRLFLLYHLWEKQRDDPWEKAHAANKGPQARTKHIATKNRAILFCFLLAAVCSQPQNITRMQNTTGQASTHSYLIITCPAALLCPDPCLHVEANPLVKPSFCEIFLKDIWNLAPLHNRESTKINPAWLTIKLRFPWGLSNISIHP